MVVQTGVLACIFIVLCITHFIADFMFQTQHQALNKGSSTRLLLRHSLIYTLVMCFSIIMLIVWLTPPSGLNLSAGYLLKVAPYDFGIMVFFFVSHALLDTYRLTYWWRKYICGCDWHDFNDFKLSFTNHRDFMVNIVVDQIWHTLVIALVSWVLYNLRFGSVWLVPSI